MTNEQAEAAIKSLAEELSRLSHTWPVEEDEGMRLLDESVDLADMFHLIPGLCGPHIAGLAKLVSALWDLARAGEPNTPTKRTHQIITLLSESEADYSEGAHAALYAMCAVFATSGDDTADIVETLSKEISTLVDANREEMAKMETVN
jgi:hypothetical protein